MSGACKGRQAIGLVVGISNAAERWRGFWQRSADVYGSGRLRELSLVDFYTLQIRMRHVRVSYHIPISIVHCVE
jgi:hypothetical protein